LELENRSLLELRPFYKGSRLPLVLRFYGCVLGMSYEICRTLTDPHLSSLHLNNAYEAIDGISKGYFALSLAPGHANISWTQRLLATRNETNPSQALILNITKDNFFPDSRHS